MPSLSPLRRRRRWNSLGLLFSVTLCLHFCAIVASNRGGDSSSSADDPSAQFDPFRLSRAELLEIGATGGGDDQTAFEEDIGQFVGQFFHDSDAQLMLDLDMFVQLWAQLNAVNEATAEGRVDAVQAMITFFEPLSNYDISAPCLADLTHFLWTIYNYAKTAADASQCMDCNCTREFRNKVREFQWIFDVVDAIGKVPSAVVSGNNLWTGSWATCRKISAQKNRQGQFWRGQYCMTRFQPYNRHNPFKAFANAATPSDPTAQCRANATKSDQFEDWTNYEKQCFDLMPLLNLGLCTPDTCTDYDVRKLVQFIYEAAELSMGRKFVCNVSVQCSNSRPESQLYHDGKSMAVLCLLLAIGSLMLFGTFYDIYVHRPLERAVLGSGQTSQNKQQLQHSQNIARSVGHSNTVLFIRLFSVAHNLDYIMDTRMEEGQIRCLHGARFLSMCWIIFGHTVCAIVFLIIVLIIFNILLFFSLSFSVLLHWHFVHWRCINCFLSFYWLKCQNSDNLLQTLHEFPKYFYNQLVVQAPLAVDSFFLLSGLLTAYIFLVKLHKNHFRLDSASTWFAYYGRRYLRLTPIYVLVMLMKVTVLTYISEGPFWRPIDPHYCRDSWWANLLYIKNFVGQGDSCMGWTWYLANDFQLYAFAPILIIAMHKYKMGGVLFGLFLMAVSCAINVLITLQKGYPPAPLLTSKLQIVAILPDYWNDLYVKPYIRCGPYIIGCIVGYFLVEKRAQNNFRMSTLHCSIGWSLAIVLTIYSVFGLFNFTKTGEISLWWSLLYTAFGRLAFAVALGWTTFACETNHGATINAILGHKMFVPLSKITFSAYLLHPILLQLYYFSRPSAFHFTHSFQLLHMFFAAVATSYACALLLSLAIEVPVVNLDKLIFGSGGGKSGAASGQQSGEEKPQQQNGTETTATTAQAHELKPLMAMKEQKEEAVAEADGGQTVKQIEEEKEAERQ